MLCIRVGEISKFFLGSFEIFGIGREIKFRTGEENSVKTANFLAFPCVSVLLKENLFCANAFLCRVS